METLGTLLIFAASVLIAFHMGYKAGSKSEFLIKDPDVQLPDIEVDPSERAPETEEEIRERMRLARTNMSGFDIN